MNMCYNDSERLFSYTKWRLLYIKVIAFRLKHFHICYSYNNVENMVNYYAYDIWQIRLWFQTFDLKLRCFQRLKIPMHLLQRIQLSELINNKRQISDVKFLP